MGKWCVDGKAGGNVENGKYKILFGKCTEMLEGNNFISILCNLIIKDIFLRRYFLMYE